MVSADGADPVVLTTFAGGAPTWSPDGRHLIGRIDAYGDSDNRKLVIIDVATGTSIIADGPPHDPRADDQWGVASWQRLAD